VAETAVVLACEELEPAVGSWRRRYTTAGARGMPAHVTLLYPFADTGKVELLVARLGDVVARFPPLELVFARTAYFDGAESTLYLVPDPAAPAAALANAVAAAFPKYPPYGGAHDEVVPHLTDEVVPHLTVAQGRRELLAEIEAAVGRSLPLRCRVSRVSLYRDGDRGWECARTFSLHGDGSGSVQ
jgi:2'-5' RNA ligase